MNLFYWLSETSPFWKFLTYFEIFLDLGVLNETMINDEKDNVCLMTGHYYAPAAVEKAIDQNRHQFSTNVHKWPVLMLWILKCLFNEKGRTFISKHYLEKRVCRQLVCYSYLFCCHLFFYTNYFVPLKWTWYLSVESSRLTFSYVSAFLSDGNCRKNHTIVSSLDFDVDLLWTIGVYLFSFCSLTFQNDWNYSNETISFFSTAVRNSGSCLSNFINWIFLQCTMMNDLCCYVTNCRSITLMIIKIRMNYFFCSK